MIGHVEDCDVRGWSIDHGLSDEEHAPPTPFTRGWATITEQDIAGAVCAPGVSLTYIPVLDGEVVAPDLMTLLAPRKEPLMLTSAPALPLLAAAPKRTAVARKKPTPVMHITTSPLLARIVLDIDAEIARLTAAKARLLDVTA